MGHVIGRVFMGIAPSPLGVAVGIRDGTHAVETKGVDASQLMKSLMLGDDYGH